MTNLSHVSYAALQQDRYASLVNDPDTPPFHYGSHYSSAGPTSLCDDACCARPIWSLPGEHRPCHRFSEQENLFMFVCMLQALCSSISSARSRGPNWHDPCRSVNAALMPRAALRRLYITAHQLCTTIP